MNTHKSCILPLLACLLLSLLLLTTSIPASHADDVQYTTSTIAGGKPLITPTQRFGDGFNSRLSCNIRVSHMIKTSDNSIFIADVGYHTIRKIDGKSGIISLIAGQYAAGNAGDGVNATSALLKEPKGFALNKNETMLYFVGPGSNCVRRIDLASGIIYTVIGKCGNTNTYSGDGLTNTDPSLIGFNNPLGIAFSDDERYLFITDFGNYRLRQFDFYTGNMTTIFGDGTPAVLAPQDVIVSGDILYVSDGANQLVNVIDWKNKTKTNSFSIGQFPDKLFKHNDVLYVCDIIGNAVIKVNISTISDLDIGPLRETIQLSGMRAPYSMLIDNWGNMIVSDLDKYIYNYTTIGSTITRQVLAGDCESRQFAGFPEGINSIPATDTYLNPHFITNAANYSLSSDIMFITKYSNGNASIVAGDGRSDYLASLSEGSLALNSSIGASITGFAEIGDEIYYSNNTAIMKVDSKNGKLVRIGGRVGSLQSGGDGGLAIHANFTFIRDILGNGSSLYVIDGLSIRKIDLLWLTIETYYLDSTARPNRLAIDPIDGNLVFFDRRNCTIHKIVSNQRFLLAGNGTCGIWDTNQTVVPSTSSMGSSDIEFLSNGDLIIADFSAFTIRKLSRSTNTISLIAGAPGVNGFQDGTSSLFGVPSSLSIDHISNTIYVSDITYFRIRKLTPSCTSSQVLYRGYACISPQISINLESSIVYTDSTFKVYFTYASDIVRTIFSPASLTFVCAKPDSVGPKGLTSTSKTLSGNILTVSLTMNLVEGNYTCSSSLTLGSLVSILGSYNIQVMSHENIMKDSFLKTISASEVASIATNSYTYSKASDSTAVLTLVTNALVSSQRNTSNLDETLKVTQALNVISSQSAITTSIVSTISNMVTEISSDLSKLTSSSLQSSNNVDSTVSQVLNAYSNCLSSKNYTTSSASVIENLLLVSSKASSEKDNVFKTETPSFIMSVIRNINSSMAFSYGNNTISTPKDLLNEGVSVGSVTYLNVEKLESIYPSNIKLTNNVTSVISKLTSDSPSVNIAKLVELKYISNGNFLKVSDLVNPIKLTFSVDKSTLPTIQSNSSLSVACKYFNETTNQWLSNGCTSEIDYDNSVVNCYCNHTTTFSSFVEVKIETQQDREYAIAGIVVGSLLVILSILALIALISTSKMAPTKSRGWIPYFALLSLLIELVFSFIVANAIALSSESNSKNANIVKYVSTMISCTFYCLSILNYLILNMRYLTFRYIYEIMAALDEQKVDISGEKKFKWIKFIFTSNLFIITLNLIVAAVFITFYVLFISLSQTGKIPPQTFSSIMTGSVFAFVMFMSLLVCLIYLFDIFMEFRFVQINTKLSVRDKKLLVNPVKNYMLVNDNLAFRKEFVFFFISIIFFVISYGIGFSTFTNYSNTLRSAGLAFELLYNVMLIMSFGGLVSLVSIYEFIRSKTSRNKPRKQGADFDFEDSQLKDILVNPSLCEVFKQFAKTEHSLENIIFWLKIHPVLEVINKGECPPNSELTKQFADWKVNFIETNSPMEVNFSHATKKSFISILESVSKDERNDSDVKEVLTDLHCALFMNLEDTFSRFILTQGFEKMNKLIELKDQMSSTLKLKE